MTEERSFPNKLKEGISSDEATSFSRRIQEKEALEKAPQNNPHHLGNRRAQRFSDFWFSQRQKATIEQKDRVGMAYISKVLGLSDEIARKFAKGDRSAFNSVGVKQARIPGTDLPGFWQAVRIIFPDTYSEKDIDFLIKYGIGAVTHLLDQLEVPGAERSPVFHLLAVNAHAYK